MSIADTMRSRPRPWSAVAPVLAANAFSVLLLLSTAEGATAIALTDVTATALPGIANAPGQFEGEAGFTGGVAVGDCEGDGLPDLYFTGDQHDLLYRNRGGGVFEDATLPAGLGAPHGSRGAAFGDVDGDGDLDLFVTGSSNARHFLFVNDGHCSFVDEAVARGVVVGSEALGRSVSFGDYDRDGYLDLFVTELQSDFFNPGVTGSISHLFRNRGAVAPGFFTDVTVRAGVSLEGITGPQAGTFAFTSRFSDLDRDGWPDLVVASDFHESRLFWNDRLGGFIDGTVAAGVGTDEHGMGAVTADFDGDGRLDLFVTSIFIEGHPNATGNRLYRYAGNRSFADMTEGAGVREGGWGWGAEALDIDNDGRMDLIMTNGAGVGEDPFVGPELGNVDLSIFLDDPPRLWRNEGGGVFTDISSASGLEDDGVGFGVVSFDADADGDLDIVLTHDCCTPPRFLRNDGGNVGHWLDVELTGRCAQRDGVGAIVTVVPDDGPAMVQEVSASSTYLAQNGTGTLHFGLGAGAPSVRRVQVEWLGGAMQVVDRPAIDRLLSIQEHVGCEAPPPPGAASEAQQECTTALLRAGEKLASAAGREFERCVRAGIDGTLPAGTTVRQCLTTDPRGKMERARRRVARVAQRSCAAELPGFGPAGHTAIVAAFESVLDVDAVYGVDLDAALPSVGGESCQVAAARELVRIQRARLVAFGRCVKNGLLDWSVLDGATMAACMAADPGGRVDRAERRAEDRLAQECASADIGLALPGQCATAGAGAVGGCLADRVECDVCRAVNVVSGAAGSCHPFVEGVASPYCGERPESEFSIARIWNDEILSAIRVDLPRPPVHARNLFHLSVAMWDGWYCPPSTVGVLG